MPSGYKKKLGGRIEGGNPCEIFKTFFRWVSIEKRVMMCWNRVAEIPITLRELTYLGQYIFEMRIWKESREKNVMKSRCENQSASPGFD